MNKHAWVYSAIKLLARLWPAAAVRFVVTSPRRVVQGRLQRNSRLAAFSRHHANGRLTGRTT